MNNTITPHPEITMDAYTNYIATMFITAWIWGLIAFMVTWGNHATSTPVPSQTAQQRPACSDWLLHGIITRPDGENTQLYERTYPSGKKAWRYLDEADQWVYPRRRDLILSDNTTN